MFETSIGPTKKLKAFLRPETAQGIFVNFRNLYEQNGCKLPFAAAQIGTGFRNEISPRDGLLRVREFTMAEIEHFVNPKDTTHSKFAAVKDMELPLWSKGDQGKDAVPRLISLDAAVSSGLVSNQTLGYYLTRTYQFLQSCGISPDSIRFRQHLDTEMAHYAKDCWDAEIFTSYGWVECAGIADRHCYDLKQHALVSKKNLYAAEKQSGGRAMEETIVLKANKAKIGTSFKGLTQEIVKAVEEMAEGQIVAAIASLANTGKLLLKLSSQEVTLTQEMVAPLKTAAPTQTLFHPSVIEPSFGISRILYATFEHVFNRRAEQGRNYLNFPPHLAPIHCSILPLSNHPEFLPLITQLRRQLLDYELATEIDACC
jgi:glycyl-tRNA synthetase